MTRTKTAILVAASAYLATVAVVGQTGNASANERRTHSAACHYYYDDAGATIYNGAYLSVSSTNRSIFCPVDSDTTLPHSSTNHLNVHGSNPNQTSSYSRACVHDAWSTAASCGVTKYWSGGTGMVADSVDTSAWLGHGDWFPYLYNYMYTGTSLYGFWMAN